MDSRHTSRGRRAHSAAGSPKPYRKLHGQRRGSRRLRRRRSALVRVHRQSACVVTALGLLADWNALRDAVTPDAEAVQRALAETVLGQPALLPPLLADTPPEPPKADRRAPSRLSRHQVQAPKAEISLSLRTGGCFSATPAVWKPSHRKRVCRSGFRTSLYPHCARKLFAVHSRSAGALLGAGSGRQSLNGMASDGLSVQSAKHPKQLRLVPFSRSASRNNGRFC